MGFANDKARGVREALRVHFLGGTGGQGAGGEGQTEAGKSQGPSFSNCPHSFPHDCPDTHLSNKLSSHIPTLYLEVYLRGDSHPELSYLILTVPTRCRSHPTLSM